MLTLFVSSNPLSYKYSSNHISSLIFFNKVYHLVCAFSLPQFTFSLILFEKKENVGNFQEKCGWSTKGAAEPSLFAIIKQGCFPWRDYEGFLSFKFQQWVFHWIHGQGILGLFQTSILIKCSTKVNLLNPPPKEERKKEPMPLLSWDLAILFMKWS